SARPRETTVRARPVRESPTRFFRLSRRGCLGRRATIASRPKAHAPRQGGGMGQRTRPFEPDGPDGRLHTVLVYTALSAGPGGGVVASERLATAEGLTVVAHGPGG